MTQQFQGFLKHRRITVQEKLGFDNVHIFKPSSSSPFQKLLRLGLDNLYLERLLENGMCIVCCKATSKFCSICGTNYCSVNCQARDWERHQLVCENTVSSASTPSNNSNHVSKENISHTNVIPAQQSEGNEVRELEDSLSGKTNIKPNDRKTKLSKELYYSKTENIANEKDECPKDLSVKNICKETESNQILSKKKKKKSQSSSNCMKTDAIDVSGVLAKFETFKIGQSYRVKFLSWIEKSCMCYVIPVELENIRNDLRAKLQSSYHNYKFVKNVAVGETYLAFVNKEWCRVRVQKINLDIKNGSKKINACRIDFGNNCSPAIEEMRELPSEIKMMKQLATVVKFVAPINAFDECSVKIVGFENKYVSLVMFENASQSSTESIVSTGHSDSTVNHMPLKCHSTEQLNSNKNKTTQRKKSLDEILNQKALDHQSYRSCIVSELKGNTIGFFNCMKTDNHLMYGYLEPVDNETAIDSMRRKSNLDSLPLEEIIARPGDLVMVQEDSGRYSGTVQKKTLSTYFVYLHDWNYSINTKKVYKLDKSCYNTIDLGCHIILDRETIIKHKLILNEKRYGIYVDTQKSAHSWLCKVRIQHFEVSGTIMEARTPSDCFIPMEPGCSVIITSMGVVRNLVNGTEIPLYVQLASKEWQSFFEEYMSSFRETITNKCHKSFQKGELVFAKKSHWYRAKVLDCVNNKIKVQFVDIGNESILELNAIRKMPRQFKNMPFFSRLVTVYGSKNFMKEVEYFKILMNKNAILTMTYDSETGMNVKLSPLASSETEIESSKSKNCNVSLTCEKQEIDKKDMSLEIKLSCLSVGPVPYFTVLHIEDEEFESEGIFWGANVGSENFKYVADDLGKEIAQYCKSSKDTEYHPEIGEFCLAIYEDEWYRGLTVNKFDQRFEVFFIDFGNKSIVGPKKIRKKCSHFFSKEPLAARCCLSGFNIMTAKERESALEYLNLMVNERISVYVEEVINGVNYVQITKIAKY